MQETITDTSKLLGNHTRVGKGVKGCRGNNCEKNPKPSTPRGKRRRARKSGGNADA